MSIHARNNNVNKKKIAVEILLSENHNTPQQNMQEEKLDKEKIKNYLQIQQKQAIFIEVLPESLLETSKDKILSEYEEVLLGTS